ncbi:MAG: hypothetical protein FIO03_00125 [Nitrosopumilales archaeon]|nr:hypothetical protein [Nitrosopumilales archaeon]
MGKKILRRGKRRSVHSGTVFNIIIVLLNKLPSQQIVQLKVKDYLV